MKRILAAIFRLQNLVFIVTIVAAGVAGYFGVSGGSSTMMFTAILALLGALSVGTLLQNIDGHHRLDSLNSAIEKLQSEEAYLTIGMGRAQIPRLRDRVGNASEIMLTGRTLSLVLRDTTFFKEQLNKGTKIKLLFLNPNNKDLVPLVQPTLDIKKALEPDLETTMSVLAQLRASEAKNTNLEVRVMDYPPTQNIAIISRPDGQSNVFAEVLSHDTQADDRLSILAYENKNPEWFHYLCSQAEKQWKDGIPFENVSLVPGDNSDG